MLMDKLREGAQGSIAKIIFWLIIFSFALAGVGSYLNRPVNTDPAEVNGEPITAQDLEKAYGNERARLESQFGDSFSQLASNPAYVGQEYRMDCFPIFYQFLDFNDDPGMTFTLVYPDSTSVTFTPTFADGKMIVPAALITMAGTYTVQVADENQVPTALDMKPAGINEPNTSEFFFNNSYTQTFVASAAPAVSLLPQTGGFLEVLAGGSAILLGGVLLVVKSRRLN